jgi:hypothetical protein
MSSNNIYTSDFKPTYLYIKQHSITGLKYFGKTTQDLHTYLGSGKYWLRHIKKHGKDRVITIWCQLFTDKDLLVEYALKFSSDNNIVESKEWANLVPENGLDGSMHTPESIQKRTMKTSKEFSFLKDGNLISGKNLNKFCKLHNLRQGGMQGVLTGRLYICSGYTSSNPEHIKFWEIETPKRKLEGIEKLTTAITGKSKSDDHIKNMKFNKNNNTKIECPYYGKLGQLTTMKGNHIPYCKHNPNKKEKPLVTCSVCGHSTISSPNFYRYHNKHCKSQHHTDL